MRSLRLAILATVAAVAAPPLLAQDEPIFESVESSVTVPGWESSYQGLVSLCKLERHVNRNDQWLKLSFWRILSRKEDGGEIPLAMLALVHGIPAVSPLRVTSSEVSVELSRSPTLPENFSFGSDSPLLEALLNAHKLGSPITVSFQDKDGISHTFEVDTLWLEVSAPMFDACGRASPNNKLQRKRGAASEKADG